MAPKGSEPFALASMIAVPRRASRRILPLMVRLSRFSAADQMRLMDVQAEIATMVADGPGNFDNADVITLLLDTVDVIDLLSHIPCEGFF